MSQEFFGDLVSAAPADIHTHTELYRHTSCAATVYIRPRSMAKVKPAATAFSNIYRFRSTFFLFLNKTFAPHNLQMLINVRSIRVRKEIKHFS